MVLKALAARCARSDLRVLSATLRQMSGRLSPMTRTIWCRLQRNTRGRPASLGATTLPPVQLSMADPI